MKLVKALILTLTLSPLSWANEGGVIVDSQGDLQTVSEAEALAACMSIYDSLTNPEKPNQEKLVQSAGECQSLVEEAYQMVRKMGSDYLVGGIAYSAGANINVFRGSVAKLANDLGAEAFGGATAFVRMDPDSKDSGLSLNLAPFFGFALTPLQLSLSDRRPTLIEPFRGFIFYLARNHSRSLSEFNGWYGALKIETGDPLTSELTQRKAWGFKVMQNLTMGHRALFVYKAGNGGRDTTSISSQLVYLDHLDQQKRGDGITWQSIMDDLSIDTHQAISQGLDKSLQMIKSDQEATLEFIKKKWESLTSK